MIGEPRQQSQHKSGTSPKRNAFKNLTILRDVCSPPTLWNPFRTYFGKIITYMQSDGDDSDFGKRSYTYWSKVQQKPWNLLDLFRIY